MEDYPRGTSVGAENLFYWEKARFGPKPTISAYHVYRVRIDPPTGMLSRLVLGKIRGRIEQGGGREAERR